MVAACAIAPSDYVVEIGPGRGALTAHLRPKTEHLFLVEKDEALAARLPEQFDLPAAQVWVGDAMAYVPDPQHRWIVAGNLPYNVSLPIIFHWMDYAPLITHMVVMVQKEVGLRLAAASGSKIYGIPSVLLQAEAEVALLFHVGPGNFFPPPKVDSSVIRITPKASPFKSAAERACFAGLVKHAFANRRKMIANTLAPYRDRFAEVGLSGKERAEALSVATFIRLAKL